jgi:uncharacterized protein (DUF433 family)
MRRFYSHQSASEEVTSKLLPDFTSHRQPEMRVEPAIVIFLRFFGKADLVAGGFSGKLLTLYKTDSMTIKEAINVDPEILGGAPVFSGTRISIKTLFDYLETSSLEDFLEGHPTVSKEQAEKVIEWSSELMLSVLQQYESAA